MRTWIEVRFLAAPGAAWLAKLFRKDVYSCNWCLARIETRQRNRYSVNSPFVLRDWARTSVVLIH